MGISPIAYDVALMFYLIYWVWDPTTYEYDGLFYILGVIQLYMFYIYDFMCWAWTVKHHIDEMFCVEWEALKHMILDTFVLSMKIWRTWKDKLEVLGIIPGAFQIDVEIKLWNIGSLAIVSLGVSYKYILALVLREDL